MAKTKTETQVQEVAAIEVVTETTVVEKTEAEKKLADVIQGIAQVQSPEALLAEVRKLDWTLYKVPAIPTRFFPTWGSAKTWSETHTMGIASEAKKEYPYLLTELVTRSTMAATGTALDQAAVLGAIQKAAERVVGKSESYPHENLVKMTYAEAKAL